MMKKAVKGLLNRFGSFFVGEGTQKRSMQQRSEEIQKKESHYNVCSYDSFFASSWM